MLHSSASIFLLCSPAFCSWLVFKISQECIDSNYCGHIWPSSLQTLDTLATVEFHTTLVFGKNMVSEKDFLQCLHILTLEKTNDLRKKCQRIPLSYEYFWVFHR